MPKRIQRSRTKGWRMPEGSVYVGRPSKWGNPYDWTKYPTRRSADGTFLAKGPDKNLIRMGGWPDDNLFGGAA